MEKLRGEMPDGAEALVKDPRGIHNIYRFDDAAHFFYTSDDAVSHVRADSGYREYTFNIEPEFYGGTGDPEIMEQIANAVMIDVRKLLTGRLALDGGVCVHSCVIDYEGSGVLFSAVSETGKSTHAHLWQEVFPQTEIVDGDNGICRLTDGAAYVFGTPWCGTSNEYQNKRVPIKAIVFLEQAKENSIEKLGGLDAFMRLSARCFLPFWDKE